MPPNMGGSKTNAMLPDGAPTASGVMGECEEDDEEGVLPYIEQRVRKRGRLKRSKLEGEDVKGVSGSEEAEPIFHLLNKSERLQRNLSPAESKFLWHRAQKLAENKQLTRVRLGSKGLTPEILDEIGTKLNSKELVRVNIPLAAKIDVGFVEFLLPDLLDCVVIKTRGKTVTIFRDGSLPSPRLPKEEGSGPSVVPLWIKL